MNARHESKISWTDDAWGVIRVQAGRSAVSLDRFRIVAGLALLIHFSNHLLETVPLLAGFGLFDPRVLNSTIHVRISWLANSASTLCLQAAFGAGIVLALGIVFGAAPRLSAIALFALSIMTHWAILPIVSIDDYVANVVLGFLSLLPIGTTLCLRSIRNAWLRGTSSPVCGVAASILLLQSSFLYLSGRIGDLCGANPSASQFVAVVSQLIPVCYVLPTFTFKKLGLLLQLGIHTYLAATTGVIVANLLLAATALLFWRESQSTPRPKVHVDAGGMTAMTYVLIALMRMAGPPLRSNAMADGAEQLLADLALMPQMLRFPAGRPDASLVLMATGTDGGNGENVDYKHVARGNRVDLLLARLAGPPSDPLRIALVSGLANRYCREHVSLGHKGTFLLSSLQGQSPLAEFKCGDLGGVVYLR